MQQFKYSALNSAPANKRATPFVGSLWESSTLITDKQLKKPP